jgi:hypothetical protein
MVDPRVTFWLSIVIAVASFLTGGGANWVNTGLDPMTIQHVVAWVAIATGVGNIVLAGLTAGGVSNAAKMLTFRRPE